MSTIRPCRPGEEPEILQIINSAAEAYRGVIPADRWHEPYMSEAELAREKASGVVFWGYEADTELIGVMGIQPVRDVDLIRHAYVRTAEQGRGIGAALMDHLVARVTRPLLVGTWADATWAIGFYRRHGFQLVDAAEKDRLLSTYWTISDRQRDVSVVLTQGVRSLERVSP